MRKILFLVFFLKQSLQAQSFKYKVVCAAPTASQLIQCGKNQIIDIQNVTIGILPNCTNIPEMQRFGQFYALNPLCVRSLKQDGEQVYRRCHGEESCTLDGSVVPVEQLTSQTDDCGWTTSTALSFKYSCLYVNAWQMNETLQGRGTELNIFSPCFSSHTPRSNPTAVDYEVDCILTPYREIGYGPVSFKVLPKLVKIHPGREHCRDYLFFNRGSSSNPGHNIRFGRYYCGRSDGVQVEVWNDDVISTDTLYDVHITYRALSEAAGSKYWISVKATYNGNALNMNSNCSVIKGVNLNLECPAIPTTTTTTTPTTTVTLAEMVTVTTPTTTNSTPDDLMSTTASPTNVPSYVRTEEPNGETGNVALFGALGGIVGLVIVVAVIAVLLFFFLRKKRKNDDKNEIQTDETDETDELNGQNKRRSRVMTVLAKIKGAAPRTDEEKSTKPKPELKPKPMFTAKPQIKPKPKTIVQMETMLGDKNVDQKPMNGTPGERVAVVKPLEVFATVEKKQTRKNFDSPEEAVKVDENANIYAVPIKKKTKEELIRNKDEDEVVMVDNDDLYGTAAATKEIEVEIETIKPDVMKDEGRSNEDIHNGKGDVTPESNKRGNSGDTVDDGLYSVATPIKEDRGSTENEKQGDEDILYDNANLKPTKNNELKSIEDNVSENKDDLYDNANLKPTKNSDLKSIEDNVSENNDDDWDDDEQLKLSGLNKPGNRSSVV